MFKVVLCRLHNVKVVNPPALQQEGQLFDPQL